jgi:hypothetical protein
VVSFNNKYVIQVRIFYTFSSAQSKSNHNKHIKKTMDGRVSKEYRGLFDSKDFQMIFRGNYPKEFFQWMPFNWKVEPYKIPMDRVPILLARG